MYIYIYIEHQERLDGGLQSILIELFSLYFDSLSAAGFVADAGGQSVNHGRLDSTVRGMTLLFWSG